jgi:purine catabolism regulator
MAITVRELLELPHLALELRGGAAGVDVSIGWAHVSEVEDPTPWLEGGELLLTTGLGLSSDPAAQVDYVKRLARTRAVGLIVVADSAPPLAQEMAAAADELAFPLVTTLLKQPFQAISKLVYAANVSAEVERVVRHLRIYGVLRTAAAESASREDLLARLSTLTGLRLAVVRQDGRPRFWEGPVHSRWHAAKREINRLAGGASRGLYARLAADSRRPAAYVVQVDAAVPSRVFLIAEGLSPTSVPDLVAVHHIATIIGTQVLSERAERSVRRRIGEELLHELLEGTVTGAQARARLRALAVPTSRLVALVVRPESGTAAPLADVLHEVLLDCDLPALVGRLRDDLAILAPAVRGAGPVGDALERIVGEVERGAHRIGVGTPVSPSDVRASCREALFAAGHASETRRLVHFAEVEARLSWLPPDSDRLALLVERTVGPLMEYDGAHGTELLRTLRDYLRSDGSPSKAAKSLHVHRNTLAYRLRKIETLTGRSLRSLDDQVELWLGVRAYEVAGESPA